MITATYPWVSECHGTAYYLTWLFTVGGRCYLASFLTDVADLFLAAAPLEAAGRLEGGLPLFLVAASGVLGGVLDLTEGVDGAELTTVIQPNIK